MNASLTEFLNQPLTIGNRTISGGLILAPMTHPRNTAMRELLASFGGFGLLFSEMCSAGKIPQENRETSDLLCWRDQELPHLVCHIVGFDSGIRKRQCFQPVGLYHNAVDDRLRRNSPRTDGSGASMGLAEWAKEMSVTPHIYGDTALRLTDLLPPKGSFLSATGFQAHRSIADGVLTFQTELYMRPVDGLQYHLWRTSKTVVTAARFFGHQ